MSGAPSNAPGVWQSEQPATMTRYLPRAISASSARAGRTASAAAAEASAVAKAYRRIVVSSALRSSRAGGLGRSPARDLNPLEVIRHAPWLRRVGLMRHRLDR